MASLLSGAAFMLCILLGSLAEQTTNLSATSSARVSNVRRVLNETLEVRQSGNRTVSVIVINHPLERAAALFQDQARVEAYAGSEVTAVQCKLRDYCLQKQQRRPFQDGFQCLEVSHFNASCGDHSETTIVIITDEHCLPVDFLSKTSCGSNHPYIFRIYLATRPSAPRYPYIPLGPRNTFPFAKRSREIQLLASSREMFFNLQVSTGTSPRRKAAINITELYASEHPEIHVHLSGSKLSSDEWMDLLHQSKFTICPGGHNPETFRMFEALEAGSIPIVSRQDYLDPAFFPDHPCGDGQASWNTVAASPYAQAVSVDSWEDLPQLLDRLAQMADDTINQLQVECERWYAALLHGTYDSLLHCSSSPKFYPQDGPITPLDLHADVTP